jgi:uncharacterized membrane protein
MNLGSMVKNGSASITNTESVKFKMLFWNVEEDSYNVNISVKDYPEKWIVFIDPVSFILNRNVGEESISLTYYGNVRAKVVNLFVKPDSNSKPGTYLISLKAETDVDHADRNIIINPDRIYNFEINIIGNEVLNEAVSNNKTDFSESEETLYDTMKIQETGIDKNYFYLLIFVVIALISIVVYKKYN